MKRGSTKPKDWMVIGAKVDYSSIIGGPATMVAAEIRSGPERLSSGEWVVWLEGKSGCVSISAITPSEAAS